MAYTPELAGALALIPTSEKTPDGAFAKVDIKILPHVRDSRISGMIG